MLYFSEFDGASIYTSGGKSIGSLDDLVFYLIGTPYIKKIVIASPSSFNILSFKIFKRTEKFLVPVEDIKKIDTRKIIIDDNFRKTDIEENELYVKKNLLDTQVIDIEENNIVRVNDVLIQRMNSHGMVIYGVDIGMTGVLRWFNLEKFLNKILSAFGKYYIPQSVLAWSDIQPLELTRGRVVVKSRFDNLTKLHPADLADYLETQNFKNAVTLMEGIDKEYLAEVISELNPNFQTNLFKIMPVDKIAIILSIMDPDDAVDVISQFSSKKQEIILKKLSEKDAVKIRKLLKLSETPLGEYLNSEYFSVNPEDTAANVIKKIKDLTSDFSKLDYIYVVNKDKQIIGVFNLHELLLQSPDAPVFKFMVQRLLTVNLNTPVEIAFRRMNKYKVLSLPVVDEEKRIIGIVSCEDINEEKLEKQI